MDKQKQDIVYALADYKQLVISYQTKYASLVRQVSFWKATVLWMLVGGLVFSGVFVSESTAHRRRAAEHSRDLQLLSERTAALSEELAKRNGELSAAQESVRVKDMTIAELERKISTTTKTMLEDMLKDK